MMGNSIIPDIIPHEKKPLEPPLDSDEYYDEEEYQLFF